jgi:hypothetical protein
MLHSPWDCVYAVSSVKTECDSLMTSHHSLVVEKETFSETRKFSSILTRLITREALTVIMKQKADYFIAYDIRLIIINT